MKKIGSYRRIIHLFFSDQFPIESGDMISSFPGGDGLRGGGDAVLVGAADGEEPLEGQRQHQEDGRAAVWNGDG